MCVCVFITCNVSGPKITIRYGATSDYSSLTDSQFLFGSQFWPENSQDMSQDMGFSNRTSGNVSSQSQEGSEPKISSSYHAKPFLFGDVKDKGRAPSFTSDKTIGVLDSDILTSGFLQLCDNLDNDYLSTYFTVQQNIASLQDGFAQQFEAMLNKLSSQNQIMREMEEPPSTGPNPTPPVRVTDSTVQTSPGLVEVLPGEEVLRRCTCLRCDSGHNALYSSGIVWCRGDGKRGGCTLQREDPEKDPQRHYPMQGFQDPSRAYALLQDVRSTRTIMNPNCDPEQSSQPDHSELAAVPSESPKGRSTMAVCRFTQRGQRQRKQPFRSRRRALMPSQTRSNGGVVCRGQDENRQPLKTKGCRELDRLAKSSMIPTEWNGHSQTRTSETTAGHGEKV
ncbi:unnamed protein product [Coregonus sp. 'balchen']|nr:unnamed protein product [Coregonus sp. 'balchen']